MENLRRVIGIYFQQISSYNILNGDIQYRNFNKHHFNSIVKKKLPYLSDTDTDELYVYLKQMVDNGSSGLDVFTALKIISNEYLMIRDDKPICRYNKLLNWRELAKEIGEDLPICAFLAYRTQKTGYKWNDFEWDIVIGHDNMQLNRILQRGISDNHFHLFGSAPTFQLVWIKLMNQINNKKYINALKSIDKEKRKTREHYLSEYVETPFEQMHFQAGLIRLILFLYIHNLKIHNWKNAQNCQAYVEENDMRSIIIKYQAKIQGILTRIEGMDLWGTEVQNDIDSLRLLNDIRQGSDIYDYANLEHEGRSINHEFEGERAFMYQMLQGEIDGEKIPNFLMNWFYAYLAIQIKFREELVQVNDTIGFENFKQYSKRKGKFLYSTLDNKKMIQHAIQGSFESGNLKKLEVRITPGKKAKDISSWIRLCDNIVLQNRKAEKEDDILETLSYKKKQQYKYDFYYVFHFPKQKDRKLDVKCGIVESCRHEKLRNELEVKAKELIKFRENYPKEAARVLGIDACSQEIDCRPEVFASVFQRLTNHIVQNSGNIQVKQWKITYHVGEDGRDFVDGLRAIDEAIRFLKMKNGDRLGHGTFLGLDVKKWYEEKRNTIYLPLHDYLDNIVWMYHKLIEFDITTCETLKGHLLAEYDSCFNALYAERLSKTNLFYGINTYYEAWKHRDANPKLYKTGEYTPILHWGENVSVYTNEEGWYNKKEIINLLYYYHYSADIRYGKNVSKKKIVPQIYVDGVEKIQKAMQRFVAEKGVCIEANPSSNLVISSMKKYEEHPICNLYNLGLTMNSDELEKCPQVHISINTDDKGVFHTSLENEYALMGRALEKMVDERGNQKYHKQMIYDWIEHIRQNGNQQSFLEDERNETWNYYIYSDEFLDRRLL